MENDSKIIVMPPDCISPQDKEKLLDKGYIVIEAKEPERVNFLLAKYDVDSSDMFMAALKAIGNASSDAPAKEFCIELWKRLKAREPQTPPSPKTPAP